MEQSTAAKQVHAGAGEQPVPTSPAPTVVGHADAEAPAAERRTPPAITVDQVREILKEVYDPEIGIDIINLGLVYGIDIDERNNVTVTMTLTSPACPLGPILIAQIEALVGQLPGVGNVTVNLVWSPPWDPFTMCSEEAKAELGLW